MHKLFLIFAFLFSTLSANVDNIYLTGDNLKAFCHHIVDVDHPTLDTKKVQRGDLVYVVTPYLDHFFRNFHSLIKKPYILVSHDDDNPVPGAFGQFLHDNKIIAWFAQNVQKAVHPKLHPMPIGMANKKWWCGDIAVLNKKTSEPPKERNIALYMNFTVDTNKAERGLVHDLFKNKPYCKAVYGKSFEEYLDDLQQTQFVLSPRGNGLDCHRTWECILMGAIPVVKSSDLDPLFEDLPVLIIDNWQEISPRFLRHKYEEMKYRTYKMEKIFLPYWLNKIDQVRQDYLSKKQ